MGYKVITAPNVLTLVPMVELLRHLKDEGADANRQAEVQAFLGAAHAHAQHLTGKSLGTQTLELALDAFPDAGILLPGLPVASITSVKYLDPTGTEQTLSAPAYVLDNYGSQEHWLLPAFGTAWPATIDSPNAVKVRYQAGDVAALQNWPAVRNALLLHVAALDMNRDNAEPPPAVAALLNTEKVWAL